MKNTSRKIIALITLITVIFLSIFVVYIYNNQKTSIKRSQYLLIKNKINTLSSFIDVNIDSNQKNVNTAMNIAHMLFYKTGKIKVNENKKITIDAINQITKKTHTVKVNSWELNGVELHSSFKMVDKIKAMSVETATIFQKIDKGYLRISTNVMKLDGNRAVGTFIPNSSNVIKTCEQGKTYTGRAYVVNDWYLTAYEPIYINGEVKGILYVGLKEKKLDELKYFFRRNKQFKSEARILVDEKGKVYISNVNSEEGKNYKDKDFFNKILTSKNKEGSHTYKNNAGIEIVQFYKYVPKIKSYILFDIEKNELNKKINNLFYIIIIGGLLITGLLILTNGFILNNLFKNLNKFAVFSQKVSEGKLDHKLDYNKDNDLGKMANSLKNLLYSYKTLADIITLIAQGKLNEADISVKEIIKSNNTNNAKDNEFYNALQGMIQKLTTIAGEIQIGAENIANASLTINNVASSLAKGANIQASSSEEVSSSMEEMTAIISQTNQNAHEANEIATKAASKIHENNKSFKMTMEAMDDISNKIKTIDKIAEKTDVLAINAAITAARAGEKGSGFAVVAQEIRKLAENTKLTAKEINEVVKVSLTVAQKSAAMLEHIVPEIEKTALLVQEINIASNEQNSGAMQINNAIQELTKVVQENTGSANIVNDSSNSMTKQAEILEKTISFFNTGFKNTYIKKNK